MSGGRFLVSLREVQSSEKILQVKSLLKEKVAYWNTQVVLRSEGLGNIDDFLASVEMTLKNGN